VNLPTNCLFYDIFTSECIYIGPLYFWEIFIIEPIPFGTPLEGRADACHVMINRFPLHIKVHKITFAVAAL
jgi:hypothetical protein